MVCTPAVDFFVRLTVLAQLYSVQAPKTHPIIKQRVASYHTTEVIAHRKPKSGCHGNVPYLQGIAAISAFCRPTTQTPSITNRLVAVVHTKPVIAILVPKLVAMATSFRPSMSGMSSLDSLTPKTHP